MCCRRGRRSGEEDMGRVGRRRRRRRGRGDEEEEGWRWRDDAIEELGLMPLLSFEALEKKKLTLNFYKNKIKINK